MEQDVKLLPIAKLQGKEYLVDVEKREFREFDDPDNVIMMHSPFGRQIVREIQGTEWRVFGLSTGRRKELEV